nr:FtsK/SpoIIIE domain-containing protein [uncultured Actinotalea sp.]
MRFTLDPGGDAVVRDGVTLAQCRDGLVRLTGRPDLREARLAAGATVLPDDHVAGAPPWVAGSVLRWVVDVTPGADPAPGRTNPDPAAASARAAWHVAVTGGPGTGEVYPPDPTGRVAGLDARTPGGASVHHRPAGRVRARRWWLGDGTGRRRRVRPGEPVRLGAAIVEVRIGTGDEQQRARRSRADGPVGAVGRRRRPGPAVGAAPHAGRRGGHDADGLVGRLRDLRALMAQPAVVVPLAGSLVLATVLRSPLLLLMGLVGPLTVLAHRREPGGRGDPRPGAGGAGVRCDGLHDDADPDHAWDPRPVAPPSPGRRLADPAAAAVRAALLGLARSSAAGGGPGGAPTGPAAAGADHGGRGVERAAWWRFATDGGLAVVGPRDIAAGTVRAILADALADPTLPLSVLPPADPSWSWLRWLGPRLAGRSGARVARTPAQAEAVLAASTGRVLVLDADGGARRPALHRWWTTCRSPAAGLVLLEEHEADLPAWCPWVLEVRPPADPSDAGAVLRGPDASMLAVEVPRVTVGWAERHARRCAALPASGTSGTSGVPGGVHGPADAEAEAGAAGRRAPGAPGGNGIPLRVSPADLGLATETTGIVRAWAAAGSRRRLDLALGADGAGAVGVDLVGDGPHVLVAGTTGAGKSELLQTLLLALALTRPPSEVAMVLLDYKGGAGFGRTRDLPHVTGMVTDLDAATAARALAGLRTELRRREECLAAADVTDVADLPQPPPRLVVVVDEFRALVEDLPEFVPALVRLATQGRSLGMHLVLATQRPAGVVDAQLRANLPLRICLRVTDPADSRDVVEVPDAAGLSAATPGRAVLARPGAGPVVLQTAWAALPGTGPDPGAAARGGRGAVPVRPGEPWSTWCPWHHPDVPSAGPAHGQPSPEVVDRLVAEVVAAHRATGGDRPEAPWLPPLPDRVTSVDVLDLGGAGAVRDGAVRSPLVVRDLPDLRRRDVVGWDRAGHLAVVGGPGSGRTTTLRAAAAAALAEGAAVHVLTAGSPDPWHSLGPHPGLGTVVGPEDPARAAALVRALLDPTLLDPTPLDPGRTSGPVLLCVDDAAGVVRSLDLLPRAPGAELLDRVLRESRTCGVAVAVSTLPAEAHRLLRHVTERVVLRVDDGHDALGFGVPRTLWSPGAPPGRGVHVPPPGAGAPRLCQVVLPPAGPPPAAPRSRVGAPAGPLRIAALPASVRLADVVAADDGGTAGLGRPLDGAGDGTGPGGWTSDAVPVRGRGADCAGPLLGVGGDRAGPVRVPAGAAVLVVGPAGSGRTTALRTLAAALRHTGEDVQDDPAEVLALATGEAPLPPSSVVLVDDVEVLLRRRPRAEDLLAAWVDAAEEGRRDVPRLVVAARTDRVAAAYRGLLAALRTTATLVVLAPGTPGSAEVAGADLTCALDPLRPLHPGRAALVVAGRVARVQVALP